MDFLATSLWAMFGTFLFVPNGPSLWLPRSSWEVAWGHFDLCQTDLLVCRLEASARWNHYVCSAKRPSSARTTCFVERKMKPAQKVLVLSSEELGGIWRVPSRIEFKAHSWIFHYKTRGKMTSLDLVRGDPQGLKKKSLISNLSVQAHRQ